VKSITRILVVQLLAGMVTMMFAGTVTGALQQDQRAAAAKELEPLVLDFYTTKVREGVAASAPAPYVSLTVATKRYDTAYALVSFSIDTNDPKLLDNVADLTLKLQPVEVANRKIIRTLGNSTSGVMKAPGPSRNGGTLHKMSFSATAPEGANGINLRITLATVPRPLQIDFYIDLTNEVRIGASGETSPTMTTLKSKANGGLSLVMNKTGLGKLKLAGLAKPVTFLCCCDCHCKWIAVVCPECAISDCCDTCNPDEPAQKGVYWWGLFYLV
jgi:hypothetical protein